MDKQSLVVASLFAVAVAAGGCSERDRAEQRAPRPTAAAPAEPPRAAAAPPVETAPAPPADDKISEVSVSELAGWRADERLEVAVFDANGADTRKKVGTIPGAVLLDDYANCRDQLPADRAQRLVFYCYNEMCGASHAAAQIAVDAGFEDVSVLTAGIVGWKNAGQPVERL